MAPQSSAMGPGSPPPRHGTSAATPTSPRSCSTPTACRWTWDGRNASPRHTSAEPSPSATSTASSPAATPRTTGATSTTSCTGSTAATPPWRTQAFCANGTTPRSTTGSRSFEIPTADGTPTGPTAPRYSSSRCGCEARPQQAWRSGGTVDDDRNGSRLELLRALVGSWTTEGVHPLLPGEEIRGETSFEWLDGEQFLIMRAHYDHAQIPDAVTVTGVTDDQLS